MTTKTKINAQEWLNQNYPNKSEVEKKLISYRQNASQMKEMSDDEESNFSSEVKISVDNKS